MGSSLELIRCNGSELFRDRLATRHKKSRNRIDLKNRGFHIHQVLDQLEQLRLKGGHQVEIIDTTEMSDDDRFSLYLNEAIVAARRRYRVRRTFGSNSRPGKGLGREVPALIVYSEGSQRPEDVYPHESSIGEITTIADYLLRLTG